jgi:hypothetical protein
MRLQKSSPGFRRLDAYIGNHEQISHRFGLLHGYVFHSFDIVDAITKGVNDLDVLDVRGVVSGIAEMLDIIVRLSSCFCLMVLRVSTVDEHS